MASLSSSTTLLFLLLSFHILLSIPTFSEAQFQQRKLFQRRSLTFTEEDDNSSLPPPPPKKKSTITTTTTTQSKNQTKLLKPKKTNTNTTTTKALTTTKLPKPSNSTKPLKPTNSTKLKPSNSTKLLKPSNSTKPTKSLNSTTPSKIPKSPQTLDPSKKPSDLPTKTTKPKSNPDTNILPWYESTGGDDSDLISEFRNLPAKFHQSFLPDLETISTTSRLYLSQANREITRGVKPLVGNRYAPAVASAATSAAAVVLPLLFLTALFHQLRRAYLSLPRFLLFVHAYLAIYFSILAITAAATGLEPLRLFYVTSKRSYVYTQVFQTLGYVIYLLLLLMNMVVVFASPPPPSSTSAPAPAAAFSRALGMGQVVVGVAVGLHYYAAVFHRAVQGEAPRTNWRVHGVYAVCFLVICAFARAEHRKKAYLHGDAADDGKKN